VACTIDDLGAREQAQDPGNVSPSFWTKSSDFTYVNFSATRPARRTEDVDAPNPALLWVALLEQIPPQNDHAIAHSQDLFGLEPSL
jgi:hypothetical protein